MSQESEILDMVADLIGYEAFKSLLKSLGGRRVYVPASIGAHHPLAQAIGLEKAQVLSRSLTGETINLPLTARKRDSILRDLKNGNYTVPQICAMYWCSRATVFRLKAQLASGDEPEQIDLF